jgi:hypothetical protein
MLNVPPGIQTMPGGAGPVGLPSEGFSATGLLGGSDLGVVDLAGDASFGCEMLLAFETVGE